jgi:hypothetical protein
MADIMPTDGSTLLRNVLVVGGSQPNIGDQVVVQTVRGRQQIISSAGVPATQSGASMVIVAPVTSGSVGANADMVDGLHAATNGLNAHVVATDSTGGGEISGLFSVPGIISITAPATTKPGMLWLSDTSTTYMPGPFRLLLESSATVDTRISSFAAGGPAIPTDTFPVLRSGNNIRLSVGDVSALSLPIGGGTVTGVITSTVSTGTPPFVITSTDLVLLLNADMVDGLHAADFTSAGILTDSNGDVLSDSNGIVLTEF